MECDPELAKSAQEWTDQQAAKGYMHHSKSTDKFTESISWKGWGWEGMDQIEGAIPGAVRSWYSEIKNNYDYQTGRGTGVIGHFQAVIWKGETKLGCGLNIKPDDGTYVTAHYAPPSHTSMEKEKLAPINVKPRKPPGKLHHKLLLLLLLVVVPFCYHSPPCRFSLMRDSDSFLQEPRCLWRFQNPTEITFHKKSALFDLLFVACSCFLTRDVKKKKENQQTISFPKGCSKSRATVAPNSSEFGSAAARR